MILLCDEDIGTGIPQALELVGFEAMSLAKKGWLSTPDVQWLTHAGRHAWIVLSCNKKMLEVPQERDTIVRERVGIVFLTSGEENLPKTLRLLLGKMDWFETIDMLVPRPFAYYLYPRGRTDKKL
ncbi:MAG: hypothetical protein IH862_01730 [Chloroflexi bacterium]|nr:hypothetical protein [Chloroflexota bacterium]